MSDTDRTFAPDARYGASDHSGTRVHDTGTGQEHWSRPVGVDTLLDAGAEFEDPSTCRLASHVEITPYQPPSGRWAAKISRGQLDPQESEQGAVRFVSVSTAVETQVFDDREAAVEWVEESVQAFADADTMEAPDR